MICGLFILRSIVELLFCSYSVFDKELAPTHTMQQVKAENPDMKITEMSKVLGARWREMDEKQKAPYQKKADADKARLVKQQPSNATIKELWTRQMWDLRIQNQE